MSIRSFRSSVFQGGVKKVSISDLVNLIQQGVFEILKVTAPILGAALIVGLIVAIFQATTSIQEQTLTFVPKVLGVFLVIMIIGNWMLTELSGFIVQLWSSFSQYVR